MDSKTKKTARKTEAELKKQKALRQINYIDTLKEDTSNLLELCDRLTAEIVKEKSDNSGSRERLNELLEKYEALLKVIDDEGLYEHNTPSSGVFKYYPDYNNRAFNNLIYKKKEFYLHKGALLNTDDPEELEKTSKKMCDPLYDSITGEKVTDKSM